MNPDLLPLAFLLGRPLSPAYSGIMRLRAWVYKKGLLAAKTLPCPVISIGNITLGGTGKTPFVMAVAEWLKGQGIRPAIVTRGYGGRAGKGPALVSRGEGALLSPLEAGDEPAMMADQIRGIPIVAGSDRFNAGLFAINNLDAQVILLDDGFQHIALNRDIDIVLIKAGRPFGTGRVFPGGDLREPLRAIGRATAIVITDSQILNPAQIKTYRQMVNVITPGRPVFLSQTRAKDIINIDLSMPVFVFCGIGSPETFFEMCTGTGADIRGKKAFRDHHAYTLDDIKRLTGEAIKSGAKSIVTTAKDAVKVKGVWHKALAGAGEDHILPLVALEIEALPEAGLFRLIADTLAKAGIKTISNLR